MDELVTIEELKKRDEELNAELLKHHLSFATDGPELKSFVSAATDFTDALDKVWGKVTSMQEYNWLRETALKWQGIYSSVLNIPKDIPIPSPATELRSPLPTGFLSEDALVSRLKQSAGRLSLTRKLDHFFRDQLPKLKELPSSDEDKLRDWRSAEVEFATQVLDGEIDFVGQIASESYRHLEAIWLREVKQHKAYCIWEGRGGGLDPWHRDSDYFQACDQLRQMLVAEQIKKTSFDFEEAKLYLEKEYLDDRGILDTEKARSMLNMRAYEVWASGGDPDSVRNYEAAEEYLKMFYENIIPAVIEDDIEKTLAVLTALRIGTKAENRYRLVNCFEAALAIYFLNLDHIRKIWAIGPDGLPLPSENPLIFRYQVF
jgi:hypothetical protein